MEAQDRQRQTQPGHPPARKPVRIGRATGHSRPSGCSWSGAGSAEQRVGEAVCRGPMRTGLQNLQARRQVSA